MNLLVNLDVPDRARAEAMYRAAFSLTVGRRFGPGAVELLGAAVPIYLLEKPADAQRTYARHWTPLHLDVVVVDLDAALAKAEAAGLTRESKIRDEPWGRIVQLHDPFGHGWCLIQFSARGYDAIAT